MQYFLQVADQAGQGLQVSCPHHEEWDKIQMSEEGGQGDISSSLTVTARAQALVLNSESSCGKW